MQIESLRYFIALAETGSFYAASKRVFISQQGLNRAISSLESECETKLVERSRRGVRLTKNGDIFLAHARSIVADYDSMLDELYSTMHTQYTVESPLRVYATYYSMQIASAVMKVEPLLRTVSCSEEPFDRVVERAANSDGSDLVFVDLHADSFEKIRKRSDVDFDPIFTTQFGVVWQDGSILQDEPVVHRETIQNMPIASNSNKELERFEDWIFEEFPLTNKRLDTTNPIMTLQFANSSPENVATYDSFGFMLSELDPEVPTDGLHFTPLSTPKSMCYCGFLLPKGHKLSLRAAHAIKTVRQAMQQKFGDYLKEYPIRY